MNRTLMLLFLLVFTTTSSLYATTLDFEDFNNTATGAKVGNSSGLQVYESDPMISYGGYTGIDYLNFDGRNSSTYNHIVQDLLSEIDETNCFFGLTSELFFGERKSLSFKPILDMPFDSNQHLREMRYYVDSKSGYAANLFQNSEKNWLHEVDTMLAKASVNGTPVMEEYFAGENKAPVPEPATVLLLGLGLICFPFINRARKKT